MIVKNIGYGFLEDENGKKYMADIDGYGHAMDLETGELYAIKEEKENNIIEITQNF